MKKSQKILFFAVIMILFIALAAFMKWFGFVYVNGKALFISGKQDFYWSKFCLLVDKFAELEQNPDEQTPETLFNKLMKVSDPLKRLLFKQYENPEQPLNQRRAYFNFLCDAVAEAHCGLDYKEDRFGYTWQDVTAYFKPRTLSAASDDEFIYMCDEMISLLDDGHTWIGYHGNKVHKSLPVGIEKRPGGLFVWGFYQSLKDSGKPIQIGDRLIKIDGRPAEDLYSSLLQKTIYAQYPRTESIYERRFFPVYHYYQRRHADEDQSTLTFSKPDGKTYSLLLKWQPTRRIQNMYGVRIRKDPKIDIEGRLLASRIGYIKIDKWDPDHIETFNNLYNKFLNTDALILDVRNNFGGDYTHFGQTVLSKFVREETVTLYKEFKNSYLYHLYGFPGLHYQGNPELEQDFYPLHPVKCRPDDSHYDNPVVLLVNHKHFSSTDLFITAFHELNLGAIIGRLNSFQMLGQPIYIETPWNDWSLGVSVMVPYSPKKILYEDRRITPDIQVPLSRSEIFGKSDPILDAALDYLADASLQE